jgi:hypothetical protein
MQEWRDTAAAIRRSVRWTRNYTDQGILQIVLVVVACCIFAVYTAPRVVMLVGLLLFGAMLAEDSLPL